ncbi:MAG: hypothetical protein SV375_07600 [Thermodesulfobacteriota bacterium]|nr:hypothetical protein [Thermodesulfobacteriota bacterium]
MAYDPTRNQVLKTWENDETGLNISINRYGDGEPKLQIGPRSYTKKDGTVTMTRAGRLSIDDILWLSEVLEDVKEKFNEYFLEES